MVHLIPHYNRMGVGSPEPFQSVNKWKGIATFSFYKKSKVFSTNSYVGHGVFVVSQEALEVLLAQDYLEATKLWFNHFRH